MSKNFFEICAVYQVMLKNTAQPDRPHMNMRHMRILCQIPKTTNVHLGCVTLTALPLYQWLNESASVLRYTYFASLVSFKFKAVII